MASPPRGPRTPAAWSRSSTRFPSRCCWPPPSSCSTGLSPAASRAGPARRDRRHRASTTPRTSHTDVLVVGAGPGRAGRRTDRGAHRRAGGARSTNRARRAARCSAAPTRSTASPRWTGSRTRSPNWPPIPTCCTCSAPPPSGITTTGSSWRCNGAPTISAATHRRRSAVSGCGGSGPAASSSPRAPTSVRRVHRQRPARHHAGQRCPHLPAPLRRQGRRAGRRVHHQRQRLPRRVRPAGRGRARSTPIVDARTERPGMVDECARAASRCPRIRWSPAPVARSASPTPPSACRGDDAAAAIPATCLLVSGGWNPAVHLYSQARGKLRYDETSAPSCPANALTRSRRGLGRRRVSTCRVPAQTAGRPRNQHPRRTLSPPRPARSPARRTPSAPGAGMVLWYVPDPAAGDPAVRRRPARRHRRRPGPRGGCGMRSMEHIKRYTTIGTAHDQGKTSGVVASGITAELLGAPTREPRRHHVPAAVHAGGVRRAGRTQPGGHVRPGAGHRGARLARRPRRGVRGCRAVEAAMVLPPARRGHGRRGAARMCRRADAESAFSTVPPSARSTCRVRMPASSSTCSTPT